MKNIKQRLKNLKEEIITAIINLTNQSCEVEMNGIQIRQSFSYYDEEVYHIEKIYINPVKRLVRIQLREYADSIELSEFSIEDQIVIYEELEKTFKNSKYEYRIEYF